MSKKLIILMSFLGLEANKIVFMDVVSALPSKLKYENQEYNIPAKQIMAMILDTDTQKCKIEYYATKRKDYVVSPGITLTLEDPNGLLDEKKLLDPEDSFLTIKLHDNLPQDTMLILTKALNKRARVKRGLKVNSTHEYSSTLTPNGEMIPTDHFFFTRKDYKSDTSDALFNKFDELLTSALKTDTTDNTSISQTVNIEDESLDINLVENNSFFSDLYMNTNFSSYFPNCSYRDYLTVPTTKKTTTAEVEYITTINAVIAQNALTEAQTNLANATTDNKESLQQAERNAFKESAERNQEAAKAISNRQQKVIMTTLSSMNMWSCLATKIDFTHEINNEADSIFVKDGNTYLIESNNDESIEQKINKYKDYHKKLYTYLIQAQNENKLFFVSQKQQASYLEPPHIYINY